MRLLQVRARARVTAISILLAALAIPATALGAGGGLSGASADRGAPATAATPTPEATECLPDATGVVSCPVVPKATLMLGVAVAPETAPPAIKAMVASANLIHTKPYIYGGGHARWYMSGYDCSGAVSFALHGAGLLETPMDSGEMTKWGAPGKGRWVTVYANAGHAFAVIDGLRWDTAGDAHGTGPRWHKSMVPPAGYVARHPVGY